MKRLLFFGRRASGCALAAALSVAVAGAAEPSFTVKYRSAANVYLDAGRTSGLGRDLKNFACLAFTFGRIRLILRLKREVGTIGETSSANVLSYWRFC